ncbi:MAG: leucine-rich repeat protein [Lachnospiraceae bacterium]|nr:leucine-rich repeat protein [Lachnospiraceae bacterium]
MTKQTGKQKSKGKVQKKANFRMRRSVRRTLGALFMITAILVAAIPFPDAQATGQTDPNAGQGGTAKATPIAPLAYEVDTAAPGYTDYDTTINANVDLDGPAGYDPNSPNLATLVQSGALKEAYNMRYGSDGVWYYQLQFYYYLTGASQTDAILIKYNSEYAADQVKLAETINSGSYIELSLSHYNDFFDNNSTSYTLEYADYNKNDPTDKQLMFAKYFPNELKEFEELLAKYNNQNDQTVNDPTQVTVTAVVKDDLDVNKRGDYYCEYGIKEDANYPTAANPYKNSLPETFYTKGFTLKAVEKIVGQSREAAYIAWSSSSDTTLNDAGYRIDPNGFIYLTAAGDVESYTLKGIGEKAFYLVENVELSITLPETVSYIGDEAFRQSFVKSIDIKNVKEIGNQAFMDSRLTQITWPFTQKIGTEAFRNTWLTSITFPQTLTQIGKGAFAFNQSLETLSFDRHNALQIQDFAFYDCYKLGSMDLGEHGIVSLGKGAFAVQSPDTGGCTSFKFPNALDNPGDIGGYVLAGRQQLQEVVMPQQFGYSGDDATTGDKLEASVFLNCVNLSYVQFPEESRFASFDDNIFSTVANPDFYVTGPATTAVGGTTPALPRQSTWPCTMSNGASVPYRFTLNGEDFYEIKSGTYLLSLNVNESDRTASVSNVDFVPNHTPTGAPDYEKLEIADTVGTYDVIKLGDGCITPEVKDVLGTLVIGNNVTEIGASVFESSPVLHTVTLGDGVATIGDSAFKNCPKLTSMDIGSGVTAIGAGAFEDCKELVSIKIAEPAGGTESFPLSNVGERAFCTNSPRLIIEGKIDEGYGPFEWAMSAPNYSNGGLGVRPLYKSPDPYELGAGTANKISPSIYAAYDDRTGEAVAVHYSHYDDLRNISSAKGGTNLCEAYEAGNVELTPAELAVIRAALHVEFPAGIDSIDVSGYMNATENQMNVATYMTGQDPVDEIQPYATTYSQFGLFGGEYGDATEGEYPDGTPNDDAYETTERGNDFVESVTFHTVKSLPNTDEMNLGSVEERIKSGAFYGCERLQNVTLGSAMEDVGTAPFMGCYALENIDCTDNPNFICDNRILYGNNEDGSTKLVQVLGSRGRDGNNTISTAADPTLATITEIGEGAIMDCPYLFSVDFRGADNFREIPDDGIRGSSQSYLDVILPANVREIGHRAFGDMDTTVVTIYGREVSLASDAFENTTTPIVWAYEDSAAYNTADRMPGVEVRPLGQTYQVQFLDYDGKTLTALTPVQHVAAGDSAEPPEEDPVRPGYTFTGWDKSHRDIQEDTLIYATWELNPEDPYWNTQFPGGVSGNGTGPGGTGTGPGGTGTGPGGSNSGDYDADGNRLFTLTVVNGTGGGKYAAGSTVTIQANAAPSGSGFANWSSDKSVNFGDSTKSQTTLTMPNSDLKVTANFTGYYTLEVVYGSGSGLYPAGVKVDISAVAAPAGRAFASWRLDSSGVTVENSRAMSTKATMPAKNATVTATYYDTGSISGNRLNTGTNGGSDKGTQVLITKPGISDTNVASASVSGSTDSFIVKISESAEATEAVRAALQGEFSDLTWIKYFAMDITLWDATGTRQITDTTGLSVHVTMPLPDALREYAGNNKMGAVVDTNKLEKLGVKFVTVNGVPCVSFTATHFSPYTIYVDTANLTAGGLDATPKTGDGIHPKWFLSLGLASISMILFLKKDKRLRPGTV